MIWAVLAFLTVVAVVAVLWPLARMPRMVVRRDADVAFYEAQIAEIGRDAERGLIAAEDAERAKAEAARRLIAVGDVKSQSQGTVDADNKYVMPRRALVASLTFLFVPVLAFGIYAIIGNPSLPDEPLAARLDAVPGHMDIAAAVAKVEQHLKQHPNDGKAYEVLAPIYLKLGRASDAVNAYANALRILGPSPERLDAYGGALVFAAGDRVTPQALATFKEALAEDPKLPQARFFLGVAAEQNGDKATAVKIWTKLLADAPPGAEWAKFVRQKIAADGGAVPPSAKPVATAAAPAPEDRLAAPPAAAAASIAALPPGQQQQFIQKMVDGLAQRLHQNGQDVQGWLQLVRAYTVLKETDKARAALADARKSLVGNSAALTQLDQLAHELGLEG